MANMAQAIRLALHYGEERLELQDIFGQDVGAPLGGIFTVTQGLKTAWNTPLDERGIIGTAIGISMTGQRCVAEVQFADYIFNSMDILKQAGMIHWESIGQYTLPMVVMTPNGAGIHGSIYHSHSFDSWATRLPGWKVVIPSNPLDAYGLMLSSILDPNPVLYLKPKALLRVKGEKKIPGEPESDADLKDRIDLPVRGKEQWKPRWPDVQKYLVEIGKASRVTEGSNLTIVSFGRSLTICKQVVLDLQKEVGNSIELIDLRSLYPYDWSMIAKSVLKTKKVLFVNEDTEVTNFGEHLAYRVNKEYFYHLHAPARVLAGKQVPGVGLNPNLEAETIPCYSSIKKEVQQILLEQP